MSQRGVDFLRRWIGENIPADVAGRDVSVIELADKTSDLADEVSELAEKLTADAWKADIPIFEMEENPGSIPYIILQALKHEL